MKNGLKVHPLSELVSVASGQVDPKEQPYCDLPHIGGDNIESHTGRLHNLHTAAELGLKSGKYEFTPDDILYSKIRPALNKVATPDFKGVCSADIYPVRPRAGAIDKAYLVHVLRSREFLAYTEKHSTRTNIPKINRPALLAFEIPLPPLSEQKRIADILDKADAIRRKRQVSLKLAREELLVATFREGLGDPRANPHGWPVEKLGEVITFVGGSQPPKDTFVNEPKPGYVRLVQIRDFKSDRYPTYIPAELAKRPFHKDDVMIARYGPPVFQILRGLEGSYNVALMKADPTARTTKDFIFHLLQIPEIHDVVVAHSERTAGQSGTNLELLRKLEIPIPPVEEQDKITASLNRIDSYIDNAAKHQSEANDLFNSLVQRAFKGDL